MLQNHAEIRPLLHVFSVAGSEMTLEPIIKVNNKTLGKHHLTHGAGLFILENCLQNTLYG